MNATVILDEALLARAKSLTGEQDQSVLLDRALRLLVEQENRSKEDRRRRAIEALIELGGSEPDLVAPPRRRFE